MTRRYLGLLVAIVAIAVAAALWGPRNATVRSEAGPAEDAPVIPVTIRIGSDGHMTPPSMAAAKGSRLRLTIVNERSRPARVELPGYEDLLPAFAIEPGARWRGVLLADRPGEDFAWLVDGQPAGRLAVTGSHLVEGHR